jgi:alkylated DNA nucleotide flippase Atl1
MPEERLGYPTIGTPWHRISTTQRREAFLKEAEHIMLNSSSRRWIDLAMAGEVAAGTRSRMSWAPMVITTGQLMAYEALALVLGKPSATGPAGWFFNSHTARCEHPVNPLLAAALRPVVRRTLRRMIDAS